MKSWHTTAVPTRPSGATGYPSELVTAQGVGARVHAIRRLPNLSSTMVLAGRPGRPRVGIEPPAIPEVWSGHEKP
jgi:hypothetical protein